PVIHRSVLACGFLVAQLASIAGLHAEPVGTVHFSGLVLSSTQQILSTLSVFADCEDQARIFGVVNDGRYQVDLPTGTKCTVIVGERDWESQPQPVFDAAHALPLPILVYPRDVPEPALARELIEMGEQDVALRHSWDGKSDSPL